MTSSGTKHSKKSDQSTEANDMSGLVHTKFGLHLEGDPTIVEDVDDTVDNNDEVEDSSIRIMMSCL